MLNKSNRIYHKMTCLKPQLVLCYAEGKHDEIRDVLVSASLEHALVLSLLFQFLSSCLFSVSSFSVPSLSFLFLWGLLLNFTFIPFLIFCFFLTGFFFLFVCLFVFLFLCFSLFSHMLFQGLNKKHKIDSCSDSCNIQIWELISLIGSYSKGCSFSESWLRSVTKVSPCVFNFFFYNIIFEYVYFLKFCFCIFPFLFCCWFILPLPSSLALNHSLLVLYVYFLFHHACLTHLVYLKAALVYLEENVKH